MVLVLGRFARCSTLLKILCFFKPKSKDPSKFTSPIRAIAFCLQRAKATHLHNLRRPSHRRILRHNNPGTAATVKR